MASIGSAAISTGAGMLHPGDWPRAALSNGPTTPMLLQSEAASTAAPVRVGEGAGPIECGREQQAPGLRARKMGDLVQVKPTPHRPLGPASSTALAQHSSVGMAYLRSRTHHQERVGLERSDGHRWDRPQKPLGRRIRYCQGQCRLWL